MNSSVEVIPVLGSNWTHSVVDLIQLGHCPPSSLNVSLETAGLCSVDS